jgi:hypothetical protein
MTSTETPPETPARTLSVGQRRVLIGVATMVGLVILAPIALSMQHLAAWAADPHGLGLTGWWPYLVPVGLDLAAGACIGMTVVAAWRRERPGAFGILVWVFAGVSAWAQYRYGLTEQAAGRAQDAWWAMPAFALLGVLILEMVLHKTRGWARKDSGEQLHGAAGFGARWIPGVGFWETLRAWAASRREGITRADAAIAYVREVRALKGLDGVEAMHYAFGALGVVHPHEARVWLQARKVAVTQADVDLALAGRVVATRPVSVPPAVGAGAPLAIEGGAPAVPHAERLRAAHTNRDRIHYACSVLSLSGQTITTVGVLGWLAEWGYRADRKDTAAIVRKVTAGTPA